MIKQWSNRHNEIVGDNENTQQRKAPVCSLLQAFVQMTIRLLHWKDRSRKSCFQLSKPRREWSGSYDTMPNGVSRSNSIWLFVFEEHSVPTTSTKCEGRIRSVEPFLTDLRFVVAVAIPSQSRR